MCATWERHEIVVIMKCENTLFIFFFSLEFSTIRLAWLLFIYLLFYLLSRLVFLSLRVILPISLGWLCSSFLFTFSRTSWEYIPMLHKHQQLDSELTPFICMTWYCRVVLQRGYRGNLILWIIFVVFDNWKSILVKSRSWSLIQLNMLSLSTIFFF